MTRVATLGSVLIAAVAQAGTTINLSDQVAVTNVQHFGLNLGNVTYYDSGQMMKELVFQNPGFEGQIWQSVIWIGSGTSTSAVENGSLMAWPTGFWSGGTYEFIYGRAKGRAGSVTTSLRPTDPGGNTNGTTYVFADSGIAPTNGDYVILRKSFSGDGQPGGTGLAGWGVSTNGGATATTELADLPPGTLGRQCARLTATSTSQMATVSANFDTWQNISFIQMNGSYRLTFKAKGAGGGNRLSVSLRRGSGSYWINQSVQLTNDWQNITNTFSAGEAGTNVGGISLQFSVTAGNAALVDDVSLRQTDDDPANDTPFRDPVIRAIRGLKPGFLRIAGNWSRLGDSLDNELAEPFARQRSGYTEFGTQQNVLHMGLHEFLQVCEHVGANPWYTFPATFSTQEIANLMEYFGSGTNTAYGARRASLGHAAPWTAVFSRIHLELGNENWNGGYRGGVISTPAALGARAGDLYAVVKSSPYYEAGKFNCILGEQWVSPWRVIHTHDACPNYDTMSVAGYMASRVDSYATNEEMFGSLFAEPEWWNKPNGQMYQDYTNILHSSRPIPLSIYEVNINVPGGGITNSQAALSAYTPSIGAGLGVAAQMLMSLRELRAKEQGLFSLGGYEFQTGTNRAYVWGVVHDMGVTDRKRPQYLACQLLNDVLAGDLLATGHSGDDPTWTVTGLNNVSYTNAHFLQSYAFSNGTHRAAIVLNLHRTDALEVSFAGTNEPLGAIAWTQLTAPAITNGNESSITVAPTTNALPDFLHGNVLSLPPFSLNVFTWEYPTPAQRWRALYFNTTLNEGSAADLANPDGDSLVNLAEYALGTDPGSSNAPPLAADAAGFSFTRNTAADDVQLIIEGTSDLTSNNWSVLATRNAGAAWVPESGVTVNDDGSGTVTVSESADFTNRFWRLGILRP